MKKARKFLFFLILVSSCIGIGFTFDRYKFPPYYRFANIYGQVRDEVLMRKALYTQYYRARNALRWVKDKSRKALGFEEKNPVKATKPVVNNPNFYTTGREITSVLLPLRISGIQLNAEFPVVTPGGGITVAGDNVIIADRLEQFYIYDSKKNIVRSAEYPDLPNNREDFYKWGKYGRSTLFRLHDIEYVETGGKGYLIASHETFDTQLERTRLAVHRLRIDPISLSSIGVWKRLFESTPLPLYEIYEGKAAGGRLAADGGFVYLTIGDYVQDGAFIPMKAPFPAQDKTSDFGSIIKLNIQTGEKEPISYGHRNPQGLVVSAKGEVISTEHGPRGGDELNFIKSGRNYGWPEVSLGVGYPHYSWHQNKRQGRHEGFELPSFSWVPSIGVSNLIQIQGFQDRWDGDLLVGSLKTTTLYRLRLDGEKVIYSEPIWIGQRIRDLAQLSNGTIVVWTDETQLLFLTVADELLTGDKFTGIMGVSSVLAKCLQCHHLGASNPSHPAPSLSNLVDRRVASDNQFKKYTSAMKQVGGIWSRERLTKFLADPGGFVPGTSMSMEPMTNLQYVNKLIDELERAK